MNLKPASRRFGEPLKGLGAGLLAAALEPIMIVLLGVVVGFIVISMFLPLVGIIDQLATQ